MKPYRLALLLAVLLAGLHPAPAAAQASAICKGGCPEEPAPSTERRDGHLVLLGANSALGGLTAGVMQWYRGGSFVDGFLRGAAGGAGVYLGKAIVAESFGGAGLLGRGVAGVGASVSANAAEGRPSFERLLLPLGPARLHLRPTEPSESHLSLDLPAAAALGWALLSRRDLKLDPGATLSTGAPVFFLRGEEDAHAWRARHIAGTILVRGNRRELDESFVDMALAHERIHLLQYDQFFILWGAPADRVILSLLPAGERIGRHLDFGFPGAAVLGLNAVIPYDRQPWEIEAHFFADSW